MGQSKMTMDITSIEREALKLSAEDRARLVRELLESLDNLPSQDVDRLWMEEASRRAAQLDTGEATLVPGDEVDRKARALLR
jgi:putative addiction module component (TIGR02574 family)